MRILKPFSIFRKASCEHRSAIRLRDQSTLYLTWIFLITYLFIYLLTYYLCITHISTNLQLDRVVYICLKEHGTRLNS